MPRKMFGFSGRITIRTWTVILTILLLGALLIPAAIAQVPEQAQATAPHEGGGEASLVLPDMGQVAHARAFLMAGLGVCILGLLFGLVIFTQLKNLPVHKAMREISELIYETCKTYLITQGKFILILEVFIGTIMLVYFGVLQHFAAVKVAIILIFSLIGIGGSYGVAWFGIRINTFANSRTAFASLDRRLRRAGG
jgi:K(+)-stimulated pyrophosphate-energized sodium pump